MRYKEVSVESVPSLIEITSSGFRKEIGELQKKITPVRNPNFNFSVLRQFAERLNIFFQLSKNAFDDLFELE